MAYNSQFFKVTLSSPKEAEDKVTIDATEFISDRIRITNEDGMIGECTMELNQAYLMMDILFLGFQVHVIGGTLEDNEPIFSGYIKAIEPQFKPSGDVSLTVICHSQEGKSLGVGVRDLVYPSKNHPRPWGKQELMYSDIITNLAKDRNLVVNSENIKVYKDIKAGFAKGTIRQRNQSDWAFMQEVATKINCTLWTEEINGNSVINLVDNSLVINTLEPYTFFFLSRKNATEFFDYTVTGDNQIQLIRVDMSLDGRRKKGSVYQITGSDGKTRIVADDPDTGELWVLDEAKVRGLSSDRQRELTKLFTSGQVTWEGENGTVSAKEYFKLAVVGGSSRTGEANNTEIVISEGGNLEAKGVGTTDERKENTGSKSYKTVINNEKLRKLSAEERSRVLGRIARKEMTPEDESYYEVVDTTPKAGKDDLNMGSSSQGIYTSNRKDKRDAGFNIRASIYGNIKIKPRNSYVLEGLGKYSSNYYLYKTVMEFGRRGFIMELTFTK